MDGQKLRVRDHITVEKNNNAHLSLNPRQFKYDLMVYIYSSLPHNARVSI